MTKETVLIIGLGEIGHTLFALLDEEKESFCVYGLDIDQAKMQELKQNKKNVPSKVDTMHVCLPCTSQQKFVDIVAGYVSDFKPNLTIIDSTVPPGTTLKVAEKCKCLIAHSPSEASTKALNT